LGSLQKAARKGWPTVTRKRWSAERWRDYGFVLEQALALLGLGRCRLALGHAVTNGAVGAARELFARLGAQQLVADVDRLLSEAVAARS
jgi:hypothetical protein